MVDKELFHRGGYMEKDSTSQGIIDGVLNKLTIFVVVLSGGVLAAYLGELEAICFSSIFENLKN